MIHVAQVTRSPSILIQLDSATRARRSNMSAATFTLPQFPQFDPDTDQASISQRWTKWIKRFENLLTASNITTAERKRALLLHYAGERVYDIFETLTETGNDYDTAKANLTEHFTPRKNVELEVLNFRRATQNAGETIDQYHTRLQTLAAYCEFHDKDTEIKHQIVQSCTSNKLRVRSLELPTADSTLEKILDLARRMETATRDARIMEGGPTHADPQKAEVHEVSGQAHGARGKRKKRRHPRSNQGGNQASNQASKQHDGARPKQQQPQRQQPKISNNKCRNCGGEYPHPGGATSCPANGKSCYGCGKIGHYGSVCRAGQNRSSGQPTNGNRGQQQNRDGTQSGRGHRQQVRYVQDTPTHVIQDSDDDFSYGIHDVTKHVCYVTKHDKPEAVVFVDGVRFKMMIDTGSNIDTISHRQYNELFKEQHPVLDMYESHAFPYASKKALPVIGTFQAEIASKHAKLQTTLHVVQQAKQSLISYQTSVALKLVTITNTIDDEHVPSSVDSITQEYADRFVGIGKFTDYQIKLHIDPEVKPVAQPPRKQPFHTRKKVDKELNHLLEQDIIEPATGPTPWVSAIVTPPKPKNPEEIRICVDMRIPNKAIVRERHPTPTVDDMVYRLNGATVFSKLDLKLGYHQLELDEDSRSITTFSTYRGLYRYKRLSFGINSAAEVFQHTISQALQGIQGVDNMSDDIIVYGTNQAEHDKALKATMERLREKDLTLNGPKCEFNKKQIEFYGYILSAKGLSPDPKKVNAIKQATPPKTDTEVRSFLGMANYCAKFIPDFATVTKPLRDLTRKDTDWQWGSDQQKAFDEVKNRLSEKATAAYFDPTKETELTVDASPVGLGAVLAQQEPGQPETRVVIAYASRSLTDVEQRYSQTEKEALGLVWGCEHFNTYLLGAPFTTVVTDHRPLETIFNNPKSKPPARIERWALRLQPYAFTVKYKPGANNPADFFSRHPVNTFKLTRHQKQAEDYICSVTADGVPKAMKLQEIQSATLQDDTLQHVIDALRGRYWPKEPPVGADRETYIALRRDEDELTTTPKRDTLLRGTRIVIPKAMQRQAVDLAHQGHQGVVKTKQLLREKVWFPGIDRLAEQLVKECVPCQAAIDTSKPVPLQPSVLPAAPWTELSMDFCGPLPNGMYLMVLIDDYSKFPEVEIINTTTAKAVIPKLDRILSSFGIPRIIRTDNGPPFQGQEFADYAEKMGFKHRKITPLHPKANGEAERFMQPMMKAVRCAKAEDESWKQALYTYLRNYRATPHCTLKKSPAELLLGRQIQTQLPSMPGEVTDPALAATDAAAKARMKAAYDREAREQSVNIGDKVLLKRKKRDKLDMPYETEPYRVTKIKGTMVTAENKLHSITRNIALFKTLLPNAECHSKKKQPMQQNPRKIQKPDAETAARQRHNPRRTIRCPRWFDDYCASCQ